MTEDEKHRLNLLNARAKAHNLIVRPSFADATKAEYECFYVVPIGTALEDIPNGGFELFVDLEQVEEFILEKEQG